jgi:phosphoribosylaminoimidazole-succinocarboxamide synthase
MDKSFIEKHLNFILSKTNFSDLGERKQGKVRDIYTQADKVILVSTDRHSSFDRIIAHISFKGQILNQISQFWFEQTKNIVPNHVLDYPDPNVVVVKKCQVIPVEMVVRGYITGTTNTALWTRYDQGERDFSFFSLPDGMQKNQALDEPVLTPTTKAEEHDENLTRDGVIKLVDQKVWQDISSLAIELFKKGQEIALQQGLILVDTKYEFGLDGEGEITLIDEIHTPDSSRYWQADSYEARLNQGEEPEYFDKEFLRLWFRQNCDPYKDKVLPAAPQEMVVELAYRYIQIYEQITGQKFEVDTSVDIEGRIKANMSKWQVSDKN